MKTHTFFSTVFSNVIMTLLFASVSWSKVHNLQLSCQDKLVLPTIILSGSIEVNVGNEPGQAAVPAYKNATIRMSNQVGDQWTSFQLLKTVSGFYAVNGDVHLIQLNSMNEMKNLVSFNLVVAKRSKPPEDLQELKVPENSYFNQNTHQMAQLFCNPSDLYPNATLLQIIKKIPNAAISVLTN